MLLALASLALMVPAPAAPSSYAQVLAEALAKSAARPQWRKALRAAAKAKPASVAIDIASDGTPRRIELLESSGNRAIDVPWLHVAADANLPPPPEELTSHADLTRCVAMLATPPAAGCFAADGAPGPTYGVPRAPESGVAHLLSAWERRAAGEPAGPSLTKAAALLPHYAEVQRLLGEHRLTEQPKAAVAPFVRYFDALGVTEERALLRVKIAQFEKERAARIAAANAPRARLTERDIAQSVHKGFALLQPCIAAARQASLLPNPKETLVLTFTIDKPGTVGRVQVDAPESLHLTEAGTCIEEAVATWRFPPYTEGSVITVRKFPLEVRGGLPEPAPPETLAVAHADDAPVAEASFATCELTAAELQAYIRRHLNDVQRCFLEEKQRNPKAPLPDEVPIGFVVDADGPVRNVAVRHRYFRTGPLAQCVTEALHGAMPPRDGADCPAEFGVNTRGLNRVP